MTRLLTQAEITAITGYSRQTAQERKLRELGYIVLGRDARNRVQCLATHPRDPQVSVVRESESSVVLDL